jgi:hypothetical protein
MLKGSIKERKKKKKLHNTKTEFWTNIIKTYRWKIINFHSQRPL